ncbi:hypothetical protein LTS15_003136 [Exophiala xenobiotica]|nr:hypothetical protein LTS15_003136 [Exophiala xenobiotica]
MPRTREHPHTRQQWEAIRPFFTRLYQKEGRPLSEVMKVMAERGFHARLSQIQESDMAFAARVIEKRQTLDKDTKLRIRGKELTPTDVEKYWKRKPLNVEDAALVPHTPPCLEYWTPAPSPSSAGSSELSPPNPQTRKGKEVDDTSTDFLSLDIQSAISVDDWNFQELAQSPSVPPLMIHNAFRSQEKLIFYANEYTRSSLDLHLGLRATGSSLAESTLDNFLSVVYRWFCTTGYGRAPCTAAVLELEVGKMIPRILRQKPPLLLPTLLGIGLAFLHSARTFDLYCQGYRKLLLFMKERAEAVLPIAFPLTILFESVEELLKHIGPITAIVSGLTQNLCSKWLSDDSSLAFRLHELLANIAIVQENWLDALQHAQKAEDIALQILGPSNKHHPWVVSMRCNMVQALLGMGDFGQAESMIQKGLSLCNARPDSNTTDHIDHIRSRLLIALACIRRRQGKVVEAEQILHQVLKSRLERFGPGDYIVICVVQYLRSTNEGLTRLGEP